MNRHLLNFIAQTKCLTLSLLFISSLYIVTPSYGAENNTIKIFLATDPGLQENNDSFHCTEKIYISAHFSDIKIGKHSLEAVWINPSQEVEQRASHEFEATKNTYYAWLWLKLESPIGGALFGGLNPNQDMAKYIGFWTVHLYFDGNKIETKTFQVTC